MTIAIQNHHDLALHTEALLELLADVDRPNCKLGFDAWSPAFFSFRSIHIESLRLLMNLFARRKA